MNTQDDTYMAAGGNTRATMRTVSRRRRSWIIIGALALLAAGGFTAIYVAAPARNKAGANATATADADAQAGSFRISVEVEPSEAVLVLDGEEVGSGRFVGELPRDGALHKLLVKAAGYQSQTLGFKDVPPQEKVVLKRLGEPTAASATNDAQGGTDTPPPLSRWPRPGTPTTATAAPTPPPTATQTAPTPTSTSTTGNIDPWKDN